MKKIYSILAVAFAFVAAASCSKELSTVENSPIAEGKIPMTFSVSMDDVKSTLSDDLKLSFENGDSVAVYDGVSATPNLFIVEGASGNSAFITGTVSEGSTQFTAVKPFKAATSVVNDTLIVNVPSTQLIPAGRNVDSDALVCYAKAAKGGTLAFKNAVSLLKFTLSSADVTIVNVKTNASESFVGAETILAATGDIATGGSSILYVKPAVDGTTLAAGTYYAVVQPFTAQKGIAVFATKTAGNGYKVSTKPASVVRNAALNLGTVDAVAFPEEIKTKDELLAFAHCSRFFAAGQELKLGADIDLAGAFWPNPIFYGIFNGQNHRVYNFTTTNNIPLENVGFIGFLGDGTNGATIKNLCVGSKDYNFDTKEGTYDGVSKITFESVCTAATVDTYKYPGLVAYAQVKAVVDNVVNFINIEVTSKTTCKHRDGGVCGTMKAGVTVKNCMNFGDIVDNSLTTPDDKTTFGMGGISGCIDGDGSQIINCVNKGNIISNSPWALILGGIVGYDPKVGTVDGCKNYGNVTHNGEISGASTSGGIVGSIKGISTFKNCENFGDVVYNGPASKVINGATEIGGIAGYCNTASTFENCSNSGKVTLGEYSSTTQVEVGGIIGRNVTKPASFKNCHNTGNLSNAAITSVADGVNVGGIIGWCTQKTVINNCSCTADIVNTGYTTGTGAVHVGGIFAYSQSTPVVTDCAFTGKITANEEAGGAKSSYAGFAAWNNNNNVFAKGCKIDATIDIQKAPATTYVGGIVAYAKYTVASTFSSTSVKCNIVGAPTTTGGILVGSNADATKILTFGATDAPVKVSGSFNGTALTAENYASFLYGSSSKSANLVINSSFNAE